MKKSALGQPETLAKARAVAHAAAQLLYRAAVANVAPLPAHEHANLGWDADIGAFQTHPLGKSGVMAELRLNPLAIRLGDQQRALDGVRAAEALGWLDEQLSNVGLEPASAVNVSYDLPDDVSGLDVLEDVGGLETLARWYDLAKISLEAFAQENADIDPGPGPVRCWPHHFDIATYVSLETGDAEEARGIGIGMSPGDRSYDQPYFYVNPWPQPDGGSLPEAVAPGHWHAVGFVGMVATGTEILTLQNLPVGTQTFLQTSFKAGRKALGT